MPSRSPPLKPLCVGGASHGSSGPGLGHARRCARSGRGRSGRRPRRRPRPGGSSKRAASVVTGRNPCRSPRAPLSGGRRGGFRGPGAPPIQSPARVERPKQHPRRLLALASHRLVDRRQRRIGEAGKRQIVEADDAQIARHSRPSWRAACSTPAAAASLIDSTAVGPQAVLPGAQECGLATFEGRRRRGAADPADRAQRRTRRALAVAAHAPADDAAFVVRATRATLDESGSGARDGRARAGGAPRRSAPAVSSTSIAPCSGHAGASTSTVGRPARRIDSTSGWCQSRPMTMTPSTVARPSPARASRAAAR